MKLSPSAGLAAGLVLLAAAPAAAGPTVTVRVEGERATLLERTAVTLGSEGVPGTSCTGDTAGAALDLATHGNWNRGDFASTILGETHTFAARDYWSEWVNRGAGYKVGNGVCSDHLAAGDEVLMLVDVAAADFAPTVMPLDVEAPATAAAGDVTVTVVEYRGAAPGEGRRTPVGGATVTGGAAPVTTGPDGRATVRLDRAGTVVLRATKTGDAPSAGAPIVVTASDTAAAAPPPPPPSVVVPAAPDRTPPAGGLLGLRDHQSLARGPRVLRGSFAPDPSGLATVKLRLTRRAGGACSYFSGRRERFRRTRCGTGAYFAIGDRADWTYLLPARLGRGRYVLDAIAVDRAGNRTPLARGTTRVVFTVR